jgi:hypothetical protein
VNGRLGDRLFAELEGLLDDGAVDVAGGDAFGGASFSSKQTIFTLPV